MNLLLSGVKLYEYNSTGHSDTEIKSDYLYNEYIKKYWPNGNVTRFYDTSTDFPNGSAYDVNVQNIQNELSKGYHFVNMESHGNQTFWQTENGSFYYAKNAALLQNNNPTIITTTACITNAFDGSSNIYYRKDPCLSEAFIRNPNSGILAYLGSSRYGWTYADTIASDLAPSFELNAYFYEMLFSGIAYSFAEIVSRAKSQFKHNGTAHKWLLYSVNPIGDPEMPIFTTNPQLFNNIFYTWTDGTLQINSGISDCAITLSGYETDSTWYYLTEKEIQEKSFPNLPNGNYTLCITKPNYKPFIQKINVGMGYVQNEFITGDVLYLVHDIKVGSHITTIKPTGDVVIQSGASVTIEATGNVQLGKGFTCEKGAVLQIK